MTVEFSSRTIEWRGPAPFVFAPIPEDVGEVIRAVAGRVTYGWGCIPVRITIGSTTTTTSLFPRDDSYLAPIKMAIQRAEGVAVGDEVLVRLNIEIE